MSIFSSQFDWLGGNAFDCFGLTRNSVPQVFASPAFTTLDRLCFTAEGLVLESCVRLRSRLSTMRKLDQFFGQVRALSKLSRFAGGALKVPPLEHCPWTTERTLPSRSIRQSVPSN